MGSQIKNGGLIILLGVDGLWVSRGFLIGLNAEAAFLRVAVTAGTSANTTSGRNIKFATRVFGGCCAKGEFGLSVGCLYQNRCKSPTCPRILTNCGLRFFLERMTGQRGTCSRNPPDLQLLNDLENTYVTAWNRYASSRGKGPATGKAFENWIVGKLKAHGKSVEKGKVKFGFGDFQVDAVIPSLASPQTILEIKVYTDIQHSLMLEGLINNLANLNIKIGLVTLYDLGTFYAVKSRSIRNILSNLRTKFQNRFDCFHIENGWSSEITRLINFC